MKRAALGAAATMVSALAACAAPLAGKDVAPTVAYVNGRIWDGAKFVEQPLFVAGDRFAARTARPTAKVDLAGGFVVPPLGEGHNHWIEPDRSAEYNLCYLADGVFYIRDMANAPWVADQLAPRLNRPDTVDYISALQGFTGPDAHPAQIIAFAVSSGLMPRHWVPPFDPEALFVVRARADIDRGMALLVAERAPLVKAFLAFSEEYAQRLRDPATKGNHRGMNPALLPYLVESAHLAGLKVHVHVYTAADFRTAIAAGADAIAHLPGTTSEPNLPLERYVLTEADAKAARLAGVEVTTTVQDALGDLSGEEGPARRRLRDGAIIPNLRLLKAHGVPIILGSDHFRFSPRTELAMLADLGLFSPAELLRIATTTTPKAIFPGRAIGGLGPGMEASFLVLDQDPTRSLSSLDSIRMRVKQGRVLDFPSNSLRRPGSQCIPD